MAAGRSSYTMALGPVIPSYAFLPYPMNSSDFSYFSFGRAAAAPSQPGIHRQVSDLLSPGSELPPPLWRGVTSRLNAPIAFTSSPSELAIDTAIHEDGTSTKQPDETESSSSSSCSELQRRHNDAFSVPHQKSIAAMDLNGFEKPVDTHVATPASNTSAAQEALPPPDSSRDKINQSNATVEDALHTSWRRGAVNDEASFASSPHSPISDKRLSIRPTPEGSSTTASSPQISSPADSPFTFSVDPEGMPKRARRFLGISDVTKPDLSHVLADIRSGQPATPDVTERTRDRSVSTQKSDDSQPSDSSKREGSSSPTAGGNSKRPMPFWRKSSSGPLFTLKNPKVGAQPASEGGAKLRPGKTGFKIDMPASISSSFMASEAQRMATPPVAPRLPLFDRNTPPAEIVAKSSPPPGMELQPRVAEPEPGFFRVQMAGIVDQATLEQDIPEHLPSSPLCPRHAKHRSGGKGTCPIHGKNPE